MPQKEKIQQMFDDIAPSYDAFNHLTSMGIDKSWRRKALSLAKGPSVLDVACGTGDFAIAAAKAKPEWNVTGIDLSAGMLEVMARKVEAEGLGGRVRSVQGDCTASAFADCTFDSVTVAFGVRNFEDREKGLREILRVLKPGGRFVMLELGVPSWQPARWLYGLYFRHIMPLIGGRMSRNKAAYRYLPASVLAFPGKKEWLATMERCGFTDCTHRSLTFGICRLYSGERPRASQMT